MLLLLYLELLDQLDQLVLGKLGKLQALLVHPPPLLMYMMRQSMLLALHLEDLEQNKLLNQLRN